MDLLGSSSQSKLSSVLNAINVLTSLKLKPGSEEKAAKTMLKSLPPGMRAIAAPWTKGRVYVISPEGIDAPSLIRYCTLSLSFVYAHRQIVCVPDEERMILIQHIKQRSRFDKLYPIGSWVQIRHGTLLGDVARVYANSSDSDEIYLQAVPRNSSNLSQTSGEGGPGMLCDRPPRHLYCMECTTDFQRLPVGPLPGTYCLWSKVFFHNGLQLLRVQGIHYIKHHRPTIHDIIHYTIAGIDTLKETNSELLQAGDRVREVKGGTFLGINGIVVSKSEDEVHVRYLADEVNKEKTFTLGLGDVQRVFTEGDGIEVCLGELRGRCGLVIDVPNMRELTFFDVSTKQQVSLLNSF